MYHECVTPLCRGVTRMVEEIQEIKRRNLVQLVEALQKRDLYEGMQVMESLEEIGMPAVAPLVELITTGNQNERWRSAMALARIGSPSVEPLIEVASRQEASIRNPAIWALAEIGDQKAVNPLINTMQGEESECCRIITAASLLKIDDPSGVEAVNREFERSGEEFRGRVTEALVGS